MSANTIGIFVIMVLYLAAMVIIGMSFSRKNSDTGDFYLGGRKLGPFVTAMSAEASDMSSYLLMGLPGLAYLCGMAEVSWTVIGLAIGTYLNWLFVAKRLRRYSAKVNAITLPDFFANRFHDKSNALLAISAIVIVVFFVPYTASGFAACGKLFSTLFGVDYMPAMVISAVVIVAYTTLGGFLAASTTDLIQSIIMTLALIIVIIFGVHTAGGFSAVLENAKSLAGYFSLFTVHDAGTNTSSSFSAISIVSTLAWGLGYFGMPHILLRFMAIKDEKKLKLSRRIASIWVVIAMSASVIIGVVGRAITGEGSIELLATSSESETIIIKIATLLSAYGPFAVLAAGIILAGILASTMSTADSQLLAASSSISQNILKETFKMKISEKHNMLFARVTVIIIAIIAVILARNPDSSIFGIVSFAWAGFGAAFGPVMLFSLFWKRTNRNGALAGIISGGVMVFVWHYAVRPLGGVWDIYELLPAFAVASVMIIVVSLATKAPAKEITDEFESVKAPN
ncbi:MAG: sodium/proline symporter PutP [Clostridiales bacterium]|nr:sodium/proline symporter PutP [Clostridiales bacterium]